MFTILQKDKDHHSSKYNDAPMPYQERLTWDGIALHAGRLPGYPASHGCIRLPMVSPARSLNLSNSVAVLTYEALRQQEFPGLMRCGEMAK